MDKIEIAWAAGFFDGEGCIQIDRGSKKLRVNQVAVGPLRRLKRIFGGSIGRFDPKIRNQRPYYYWTIFGKRANSALGQMLPYLCVKHKEAKVLMAYDSIAKSGRKHHDRVVMRLKQLKRQ